MRIQSTNMCVYMRERESTKERGVLFIDSTTDEIKRGRVPIYIYIYTKLVLENIAHNLVVNSVCHR